MLVGLHCGPVRAADERDGSLPYLGPARQGERDRDEESDLGARALGVLYSAMRHEDSDVRVLATERWGPLGNTAAKTVLRPALKDVSLYVRIAAAGSLFQLGDESGIPVVEKIVEAAPEPPGRKRTAMSALKEMRYISQNKIRVVAVRALARMGSDSSDAVLRGALRDRDGSVRDAASVALARAGDVREIQRLLDAVKSEAAAVRVKAIEGLGRVASDRAVKALRPLAEDPDFRVRAAVMEALGESGSVLGLPELSAGVSDQNKLVRAKAVAALGRLGNPAAIQFLQEARRTAGNAYVELLATAGLARLGEKMDLSTARRAQYQNDVDTRVLAVEVMETVGGEEAVESLERALKANEARVRVRAAAALVKLLQGPTGPGRGRKR